MTSGQVECWTGMSDRTKKQETALTLRRNTGLNDAELKDPGFSCQGNVGEFIGLYMRCELYATRLQHYYQTDKQNKKGGLKTDMLSNALEHFGIPLDKEQVLFLFQGGKGKRGKKSARQLRNGYIHELSDADRSEITNKHSIFVKEMNRFLKKRINTKYSN